MKKNIQILLDELKVSKKEFAARVGISTGNLSDIFSGKTKNLSADAIRSIKEQYDVNPLWLLTGEGEMFLKSEVSEATARIEKSWDLNLKMKENPRLSKLIELLLELDEDDLSTIENVLNALPLKKAHR